MYGTHILHPTTPVGHLTAGLPIYAYLPMNPCRLPQPSAGERTLLHRRLRQIRPHAHYQGGQPAANQHRGTLPHGPPHGPHHLRGLLPRGTGGHARRHRRTSHRPAHLPHVVWVWFVVDATVDAHLLLRIARQPLHKLPRRASAHKHCYCEKPFAAFSATSNFTS